MKKTIFLFAFAGLVLSADAQCSDEFVVVARQEYSEARRWLKEAVDKDAAQRSVDAARESYELEREAYNLCRKQNQMESRLSRGNVSAKDRFTGEADRTSKRVRSHSRLVGAKYFVGAVAYLVAPELIIVAAIAAIFGDATAIGLANNVDETLVTAKEALAAEAKQ